MAETIKRFLTVLQWLARAGMAIALALAATGFVLAAWTALAKGHPDAPPGVLWAGLFVAIPSLLTLIFSSELKDKIST